MFSDNLPKLFSQPSSAIALGRNSGLLIMDLVPALRSRFARFGMGMATRRRDMVEQKVRQYDLIVVGAGMVGAAFSCLMARANPRLQIALIESRESGGFNSGEFDPRVAALTEKSRRLLDSCGAWQRIAEKRISPTAPWKYGMRRARVEFSSIARMFTSPTWAILWKTPGG